MTLDPMEEPKQRESGPPEEKRVQNFASNSALALELPFTLAGAIGAGILLGYFLDKWFHTRPALMVLLGALGFIAGVREVIRRLPAD
jgi:F0F1-type ATP synthase assembly protein I